MGYRKKDGTVVTEDWMDALASAAEADKLPGVAVKTETGAVRPKSFENDGLESITFRIRKSRLLMIDCALENEGGKRSDFLRNAVEEKLERLTDRKHQKASRL